MNNKYISKLIYSGEVERSSYLSSLPAVRHLMSHKSLSFENDVTFFVGENGTGKSTLLEAIAVAYGFNAEGGTKNFCFSTRQTHSDLYNHISLIKQGYPKDGFFLRAESFYNVATNIDEMDGIPAQSRPIIESYGGVSLHKQSHGESFLSLAKNRFGGNGLYILDEPEAALSPAKLLTLLVLINNLVKKNSQFIISSHSPILMAYPGAQIYQLSEKGIEKVAYEETEHYRLTRNFLDNPSHMLHYLFDEEH